MSKKVSKPTYHKVYMKWKKANLEDYEIGELNEQEIKGFFHKYLEFGTGGMRGEIGFGTNRINKYIVRRATQGLAQYIIKQGIEAKMQGVVIAYDSRQFSKDFAREAGLVLANNGIKTYVFDDLRPTPELSFAVRELKAISGIVITASHNPPEYNGYKVYWEDGGQIPPTVADALTQEINKVENELEVSVMDEDEAIKRGLYQIIGAEIDERYMQQLEKLVINKDIIHQMTDKMKIIYTPLHGTGNLPVRSILKRVGFNNVIVVPEQEKPDSFFSTVKSPNPEEKEAFQLAIELARKEQADIILGTDPDADRVGVVIKRKDGFEEYEMLTGNQIGALLLEYLLSQKKDKTELPKNGVVIKTIVTSELGRKIASNYGLETIDTLTGFKFIGEKIKEFEETKEKKFIFGYEESYGSLIGDFVRDKDAVQACLMISEMSAYYKSNGLTLYEVLLNLYEKYGYYQEDLVSITLKGIEGQERIKRITDYLRKNPICQIGFNKIEVINDYLLDKTQNIVQGTEHPTGLPKSNVIKYVLEDDTWIAIRPSGTEPKLKIYIGVTGDNLRIAKIKLEKIRKHMLELVDSIK